MAVETEYKYVLSGQAKIMIRALQTQVGAEKRRILQGYLTPEARIRSLTTEGAETEYAFTFKRRVADEMWEIETTISADDFAALWPTCVERLEKTRLNFVDGDIGWDIDFFGDEGAPYFMLAEAEVPRGLTAPPIHPVLARNMIYFAGTDKAYSSRSLSDLAHAADIMAKLTPAGC